MKECETKEGKRMKITGLDLHCVSAEAVMLDDGKGISLHRVGMTREHLEAFAGN